MPWRQVDAMTERFQFVRDARRRFPAAIALTDHSVYRPLGALEVRSGWITLSPVLRLPFPGCRFQPPPFDVRVGR
jgi:hypothetical protein